MCIDFVWYIIGWCQFLVYNDLMITTQVLLKFFRQIIDELFGGNIVFTLNYKGT